MINKQMIDVSLSNTKIEVAGPLKKLTVTENGIYKPAVGELGFDEISVETHVPVYGVLEVSENGLYEPNEGVDGYNRVVVNTPEPVLNEIEITENGNYTPSEGVDGFNRVVVNTPYVNTYSEFSKLVLDEYTDTFDLNDDNWVFKEGVTEHKLRDYAFYNNNKIKSVTLNIVTEIGTEAFRRTGITNLEGKNVKIIRTYALSDTFNLTTVNLPNCTDIENGGFYQSMVLSKINIPKLERLGGYAFNNNWSLEYININKCSGLKQSTFSGCNILKTVILRNLEVESLENTNIFNGTPIKTSTTEGFIYVPDDLVESYKTATNWVVYANKIKPISELPEEVQV